MKALLAVLLTLAEPAAACRRFSICTITFPNCPTGRAVRKIAVASQKAAAKCKLKKGRPQAPAPAKKARLTMYDSTSILEGQMNNELIDALEALLEAAPDADSLRVLVGQATANKGPMSAEEFIAFARELLDAARKADQTA
jgi:major membrane immunogen (membrane-anchored lipoprotein)